MLDALSIALPLLLAAVLIASAVAKLRTPDDLSGWADLGVPRALRREGLRRAHPWAEGALAADLLTRKTTLWVHATSLGGVESSFERRRRWKTEPVTIPEGLVRLSVGIEDVEDLWEDLRAALDGCVG